MKKIHVILFILSDETETFWHLVCFFFLIESEEITIMEKEQLIVKQ